jgi:hypothetical protein
MKLFPFQSGRRSPLVPVRVNEQPFSKLDSYFLIANASPLVIAPIIDESRGRRILYFPIPKEDVSLIVGGQAISVPQGRYDSFYLRRNGLYREETPAQIVEALLQLHQRDESRIPFKNVSLRALR